MSVDNQPKSAPQDMTGDASDAGQSTVGHRAILFCIKDGWVLRVVCEDLGEVLLQINFVRSALKMLPEIPRDRTMTTLCSTNYKSKITKYLSQEHRMSCT